MKRLESKKQDATLMGLGLLLAVLLCVPYVILGEKSVITYHDQLDGELITYLLNAKHLFQGLSVYPEVMGGIPKNGMVSPAPLYVLLYKILPPFPAFFCMMLLNKLVAFSFTYLLIRKGSERKLPAFAVAAWFTALPFYPVYGLCIPGQPMLYYAMALLREKEGRGKGKWVASLLLVALYGLASSLALCGFAVLISLFFVLIWDLLRGRKREALSVALTEGVLGGTYLLCNLSLVGQLLGMGRDTYVSHKREVVTEAVPFWATFRKIFLSGEDYCNVWPGFVLPLIGLALLVWAGSLLRAKVAAGKEKAGTEKAGKEKAGTEKAGKEKAGTEKAGTAKGLGGECAGFLLLILLITVFRAFYQSGVVVNFRNRATGVLHDFNFGRFTWLLPVLWCLCTARAADLLLATAEEFFRKKQGRSRLCTWGLSGILCLFVAAPAAMGLYNGDFKPNAVKLLRGGDYYMMTWEQFFAEDLFEEVEDLIGRPKETYHVASLGIYPAAAAYNGFYCLDGYSNNYDLEYKHRFRRVIAPQLERSEYLKKWFDQWGNRCYLVLAAYNNYFTLEKRWGPYVEEYELDLESLKELGCDYIISATYLVDADQKGFRLLNEEPIQTDESWYRLWVYEIR